MTVQLVHLKLGFDPVTAEHPSVGGENVLLPAKPFVWSAPAPPACPSLPLPPAAVVIEAVPNDRVPPAR